MDRFRIKETHPIFRLSDNLIQIGDEPGFSSEIEDDSGLFYEFIELMDGQKTLQEVHHALLRNYPELTLDTVEEIVDGLDANGHLEIASPVNCDEENDRYSNNLNFFSNFSTLKQSSLQIQSTLSGLRIAVIGLGGLGSNILLQLAGLGIRSVVAIEPDVLEAKNLNRQFLYKVADLGESKVISADKRLRDLNPELVISPIRQRVRSASHLQEILPNDVDAIVCAADTPPFEIQSWCNQLALARKIPMFAGGVGALQGTFFSVLPDETACLDCFYRGVAREKRTVDTIKSLMLHKSKNAAIAPTITVIASCITGEIMRFAIGYRPISAGRQVTINFATLDITKGTEWERQTRCICGIGRNKLTQDVISEIKHRLTPQTEVA